MYVVRRVKFIAGAFIAMPVRLCIMVGVVGTTLAALLTIHTGQLMMRQVDVQ
jgi:hypothetical protein